MSIYDTVVIMFTWILIAFELVIIIFFIAIIWLDIDAGYDRYKYIKDSYKSILTDIDKHNKYRKCKEEGDLVESLKYLKLDENKNN